VSAPTITPASIARPLLRVVAEDGTLHLTPAVVRASMDRALADYESGLRARLDDALIAARSGIGRDAVVPGRCEDCGTGVLTMRCPDGAGVARMLCGWCRSERRDAGSAVAR